MGMQYYHSMIYMNIYQCSCQYNAVGYLASVQCIEVWCPMTPPFFKEYLKYGNYKSDQWASYQSGVNNEYTKASQLKQKDNTFFGGGKARMQQLLYVLNPSKFRAAEYLLNYHKKKGNKIILFSDDVPALILYCESLKIPYIYGETPELERAANLLAFRTHPEFNCIGLSKVGDTALDIPEASVIIQVASHFGARRQETQRLGRILRPKANPTGGFNAFFYTLVSTDTREMYYSTKRQQYLVDQGYTYKIIQDLDKISRETSTLLKTEKDELNLLDKVLKFKNLEGLDERENKTVSRDTMGLGDAAGEGTGMNDVDDTTYSNDEQYVLANTTSTMGHGYNTKSLSKLSGSSKKRYQEY